MWTDVRCKHDCVYLVLYMFYLFQKFSIWIELYDIIGFSSSLLTNYH